MPAMTALLTTIILFLTPALASASPLGCDFIPRQDAAALMQGAPDEVIGWTSCYEKNPRLGNFTVSRFRHANDESLNDFLIHLARKIVPDAIETVIVGDEKSDSGRRQIMIRSKRNNGKYDWHYAFTGQTSDGASIVFVHSGNQEETLANETSLRGLREELTKPAFLSQIKN